MIRINCRHCGVILVMRADALTLVMSASRSVVIFVCVECGHVNERAASAEMIEGANDPHYAMRVINLRTLTADQEAEIFAFGDSLLSWDGAL